MTHRGGPRRLGVSCEDGVHDNLVILAGLLQPSGGGEARLHAGREHLLEHAERLVQEAVLGYLDDPHVEGSIEPGEAREVDRGRSPRGLLCGERPLQRSGLRRVDGAGSPRGRRPFEHLPHGEELLQVHLECRQPAPHRIASVAVHEHAAPVTHHEQPASLKGLDRLAQGGTTHAEHPRGLPLGGQLLVPLQTPVRDELLNPIRDAIGEVTCLLDGTPDRIHHSLQLVPSSGRSHSRKPLGGRTVAPAQRSGTERERPATFVRSTVSKRDP